MRALRMMAAAFFLSALAAPLLAHTDEDDVAMDVHAEDRAAIEATLDQVYGVISGPVSQPRDFERMKTLFTPDARLTAIIASGLRGGTVEDYIERSGKFLVEQGFTERRLVNRIDIFGDLAHAWSSYEGAFTNADGTPGKVRGINSFQLVRQSDGRWLVQSIFWQSEAPERPLPPDMTGDD